MADKKISQLTAATTPLVGTEVLPIVQGTTTVKVANNDLRPKQIQSNATSGVLQVTGPAAASTRVMTTPDANFTVARTDAAQTFTGDQTFLNKVSASYLTSSGNVESTGPNLAHAASRVIMSWEGTNGAYFQVYGPDASTKGKATIRLASSDFSLTSTPAVFDGDNISCPNGNFVVGTSGKGIDFSATASGSGTMTSELFADYEEGTYEPAIGFGTSGSITLNASYKTLSYTKVGRLVTVTGYLLISSVSSPTGYMTISLPFTSASGDSFSYTGTFLIGSTVSIPANGFGMIGLQNNASAWIFTSNATSLGTAVGQQLQANTDIRISFSYVAA